jgi:hypothetical protein
MVVVTTLVVDVSVGMVSSMVDLFVVVILLVVVVVVVAAADRLSCCCCCFVEKNAAILTVTFLFLVFAEREKETEKPSWKGVCGFVCAPREQLLAARK